MLTCCISGRFEHLSKTAAKLCAQELPTPSDSKSLLVKALDMAEEEESGKTASKEPQLLKIPVLHTQQPSPTKLCNR